jgi:hypothetical protein
MKMKRKLIFTTMLVWITLSVFGQNSEQLVIRGDFVLRGTVLVQYQGNAEHVIVPANLGITEISENVFQSSAIVSVTIPEGVQRIGSAFRDCYSFTTISLPNSLRIIGDYAFYLCGSLTNVTIPAGVITIGRQAFYNCGSLTSVTIPASVTYIGENAFNYCDKLTSITADGNNPYYTSQDGILYNKVKTVIVAVPQGISGRVNIPASVTVIENNAFNNCGSLTGILVDSNNPNYASQDGILYNKEKTWVVTIPRGISGSVTIPAGITSIGSSAFYGRTGLAGITIPESVTSIGSSAFSGCTSLTSINVAANNPNFTSVDGVLFNKERTTLIAYPMSKGRSYTIPAGVTSIGASAFSGCTGLTNVTIPAGVTSIGVNAFYGCTGLTGMTIPSSVTSIGNYAFYGCTGLTSVTIPASVTSIGNNAFQGCTGLTSVTIPASVTSVGTNAFFGCTNLKTVTLSRRTRVNNNSFPSGLQLTYSD